MILNFDRGYGQSAEQMIQSLMESTQMALDNLERKLGLSEGSLTDSDSNQQEDDGNQQKDMIVEQGTSGNWIYEKRNSGIVKMYYHGTYSSAFNNGNYFGSYRGTVQTINFPFTLTEVIIAMAHHIPVNTGFALVSSYTTSSCNVYPYNRKNLTAVQTGMTMMVEVIGKWK